MNTNRKLAVSAGALALLLTTTAFADARDNDRNRDHRGERGTYQRSGENRGSSSAAATAAAAQNAARDAFNRNRGERGTATAPEVQNNRGTYNAGTYNRNDANRTTTSAGAYQSNSRGTYDNRGSNNRGSADRNYDRNNGNRNNANRGVYNGGTYNRGNAARVYHDNDRVTYSGRVRSFSRERDGYRVYLDGARESYWIPASRFGRGHELRIGASLHLGGIFRGGIVNVDILDWPDYGYDPYYGGGGYYGAGYGYGNIGGVVERVDYRSGFLLLRDTRDGRTFEVDMRDTVRASRVDFGDLRPGDYVELSGSWLRNGAFAAARIDSVDTGRY
ncbi:MAG: hypothetical protein JO197_03260 [Acidobacteria bacterium]|nr:hypothetical protein [Acidobacteriota bacterium]MBV9476598.1 hypothetical protein [Acidobacteriota bacterium]